MTSPSPVPGTTEGSVGVVATQYVDLPRPISLDCGRELAPVRVAYETYGELTKAKDNVILVCHALSGDAHAAGWSAEPVTESTLDGFAADERAIGGKSGLGWWDGMIGPGKAFDTDKFFVVSTNLLGGCRGTTGPSSIDPSTGRPYALSFPVITIPDMVRVQRAFLEAIGIERLFAVAGGSMGGMQALEWAARHPQEVRCIVPIASTAALNPQGVAWNSIARTSIMSDPDWQGGSYYGTDRAPIRGLSVARMLGHVTYLSAESMATKFGRRLQSRDGVSYTLEEADFEVESYLRHQAKKFVKRFDANTYLYFSRALTYYDLARLHGDGELRSAVSSFEAATLLICYTSDWIYPPENSEALAAALEAEGKIVELHVIDAPYGHDAFLLEEARQTPMVRDFLARMYESHTSDRR
jgi:homoserine O-acetyltransferase